jgi:3-dehydroquinate dehydratase-2
MRLLASLPQPLYIYLQNRSISGKNWTSGTKPAQTSACRSPPAAFAIHTMAKNILLINGPNLNLLGTREPAVYGSGTLQSIEQRLAQQAAAAGISFAVFQSNSEADLVERIQLAGRDRVEFIIINPAAYTHTSVAMRDALAAVGIPFIELHLSNVHAREAFRRHSYFSDLAVGVITGLGAQGYELALAYAIQHESRG